jgi:hypothetical protein
MKFVDKLFILDAKHLISFEFSKFGLSGHKRANSLLTVEVRPIKCGIFLFVLTRAFQKRKKILGVPFKKIKLCVATDTPNTLCNLKYF